LFDQGLGDLFVVRVAGNVLGEEELASLTYAAEHVDVDLIFVLGHESCGAVKATIEVVEGRAQAGEYVALTDAITPAVDAAAAAGATGDELLGASIEENVRLVTEQIPEASDGIAQEIEAREIAVVGGLYHLRSGKVTLLD
jgi:carbonic anhydrase